MSIWMYFVLGGIFYTLGAFLSNEPSLKSSQYYIYYGMILGAINTFLWFSLARSTLDNSKILLYGMYWDIIILFGFLTVPILFYGAVFKPLTWVGIGLIVVGFLLTKVPQ